MSPRNGAKWIEGRDLDGATEELEEFKELPGEGATRIQGIELGRFRGGYERELEGPEYRGQRRELERSWKELKWFREARVGR